MFVRDILSDFISPAHVAAVRTPTLFGYPLRRMRSCGGGGSTARTSDDGICDETVFIDRYKSVGG
jgi:hypothetical protein